MLPFENPQRWRVGDTLNAATLNERIRDQNVVLLRRPLTVAHATSNQTIAANGASVPIVFDTIDQDDDGMAISSGSVSDFYCQRTGTYQVWFSITIATLSAATYYSAGLMIDTATTAAGRWVAATRMPGFNGTGFSRAISATLFMSAGETITPVVTNGNTTTAITCAATNSTPRIALMWMGIT